MNTLRSPMSRVLGLGAAGEGPGHWWVQRITAVALIALGLWFVIALLSLDGFGYEAVRGWLQSPINAVLMMLLVVVGVYHSKLGVQVVIEDYVHGGARVVTLVLVNFLHVLVGAVGVFAVLRIAFGVAA